MQTCSCFSVGVSVARNRSVTLVLSRWADTISRKRRQERSWEKPWTFERNCCLKSKKVHTLWEKRLCLLYFYCMLSYCGKYSIDFVTLTSHTNGGKQDQNDWSACYRPRGSCVLPPWHCADLQLQWYQNSCSYFPPPTLIKNWQGKCSF